jgi:hypothetical protein
VIAGIYNGTAAVLRSNFYPTPWNDDLKAMPVDALFSNRSSGEFDDTFPVSTGSNSREYW